MSSTLSPPVSVVIATHNRPTLLRRALQSIKEQSRPPDRVYIVDDSESEDVREHNQALSSEFDFSYIPNRRTDGLSGSCNTALTELAAGDLENPFVAFLDDDDTWESDHLANCLRQAREGDLDMVASGLVRYSEQYPEGRNQSPPETLRIDDFLVGNPHIQGSNLFVRLDALLKAGLFDESLPSCTDRDLCIRLTELPGLRYGRTTEFSVIHHASSNRQRLSNPENPAKQDGLDRFWAKYHRRMSPKQKKSFRERSASYFDWRPPQRNPWLDEPDPPAGSFSVSDSGEHVPIIVGVIVDPRRLGRVRELLDDLANLQQGAARAGVEVVLLENGPEPEQSFESLLREFTDRGLPCHLLDKSTQHRDARRGAFGEWFERPSGQAPIASARTMLHVYAAEYAESYPNSVVWVVDDDVRLEPISRRGGLDWVADQICEARRREIDAIIGPYVGDAPIPASLSLRTQLRDLCSLLTALRRLSTSEPIPFNAANPNPDACRNYYHDASFDNVARLEHPFFPDWLNHDDIQTASDALERVTEAIQALRSGRTPVRRLPDHGTVDPLESANRATVRGGNTIVLDLDLLTDIPNSAPTYNGRPCRRSDTLWTLRHIAEDRRIVAADIPVRHVSTRSEGRGLDVDKFRDDLIGAAAYRAFDEMAVADNSAALKPNKAFETHLEKRIARCHENLHRIDGLTNILRHRVGPGDDKFGAWEHCREALEALCEDVEAFRNKAIPALEKLQDTTPGAEFQRWYSQLPSEAEVFTSADREAVRQHLNNSRVDNARRQVDRLVDRHGSLAPLGHGHEGVVLTDGDRVFKLLDRADDRLTESRRKLLRSLAKRDDWERHYLYPVLEFVEGTHYSVLITPFEETTPYEGGKVRGILDLVRALRRHRLVCRNLHPKNLRVNEEGVVKLVDYGTDLRPYDDEEFELMCRRAYLSLRWAHLPHLSELMTRSLNNRQLPELTGYDRFLRALEEDDCNERLMEQLVRSVRASGSSHVLDYGAGKGRLCRKLQNYDIEPLCYDIDEALDARWEDQNIRGVFDREELLDRGEFDTVVCSRVLCTVYDEQEYRQIWDDLRACVSDDGRLIVAVCNPFFTEGHPTPLQTRRLPKDSEYQETVRFTKKMRASGNERTDVHRPLAKLRQTARQAGFVLEDAHEIDTVDLRRLEPSSEYLVLEFTPTEVADVSLVINTCAMEHETLERQVRHIVDQLSRPRPFREVLLVVDDKQDNFVRQYTRANYSGTLAAAKRLVRLGYVDRIVHPPSSEADLRKLHERWFDTPARRTHSETEQPVAATLAGFEAAESTYILQTDSDAVIHRETHEHDYMAEIIEVFDEDPEALTVSFNIVRGDHRPYSHEGADGDWRVEVRCCMFDRQRLRASRPWPNELNGDALVRNWHRSLDDKIQSTRWRSYRGGSSETGFTHVPNSYKKDPNRWMMTLDSVEAGHIPEQQRGRPNLTESYERYLGPKRDEHFVFVVGGRNVPPGRFRRCIDSMFRQSYDDWAAILIDDASNRRCSSYYRFLARQHPDRFTYLRSHRRRGLLANMVDAIRHVCRDPDSIIVTLDADDALLGTGVLERLEKEYQRGADLTVGSMLRTDKHAEYPADLQQPRANRGGNVWQHLRSFRKRLFDAVPDQDLRLDGEYVDLANDWAYMLPMVEIASQPASIDEPLYLHEPSGGRDSKHRERKREQIIGRIIDKPARHQHSPSEPEDST